MSTDPPPSTWLPDNAPPSRRSVPQPGGKPPFPTRPFLVVAALIVLALGAMVTYHMANHDDSGAAAPSAVPFTYTPANTFPGVASTPAVSAPATTTPPPSLNATERTYRMVVAKKRCEDAVRDQLKAPSTADFSDTEAQPDNGAVPTFAVTGQVDSENGFGAQVRSSWTCTAKSDAVDRDLMYLSDVTVTTR